MPFGSQHTLPNESWKTKKADPIHSRTQRHPISIFNSCAMVQRPLLPQMRGSRFITKKALPLRSLLQANTINSISNEHAAKCCKFLYRLTPVLSQGAKKTREHRQLMEQLISQSHPAAQIMAALRSRARKKRNSWTDLETSGFIAYPDGDFCPVRDIWHGDPLLPDLFPMLAPVVNSQKPLESIRAKPGHDTGKQNRSRKRATTTPKKREKENATPTRSEGRNQPRSSLIAD